MTTRVSAGEVKATLAIVILRFGLVGRTRGGLQIVPVKDTYMKVNFGDSVILGKNPVIGEYVLLGISPASG